MADPWPEVECVAGATFEAIFCEASRGSSGRVLGGLLRTTTVIRRPPGVGSLFVAICVLMNNFLLSPWMSAGSFFTIKGALH